jgi:hypothetical protein
MNMNTFNQVSLDKSASELRPPLRVGLNLVFYIVSIGIHHLYLEFSFKTQNNWIHDSNCFL